MLQGWRGGVGKFCNTQFHLRAGGKKVSVLKYQFSFLGSRGKSFSSEILNFIKGRREKSFSFEIPIFIFGQ